MKKAKLISWSTLCKLSKKLTNQCDWSHIKDLVVLEADSPMNRWTNVGIVPSRTEYNGDGDNYRYVLLEEETEGLNFVGFRSHSGRGQLIATRVWMQGTCPDPWKLEYTDLDPENPSEYGNIYESVLKQKVPERSSAYSLGLSE